MHVLGSCTCVLTIRTHNSSTSPRILHFDVAGLESNGAASQTPQPLSRPQIAPDRPHRRAGDCADRNRLRCTRQLRSISGSFSSALEPPLPRDGFFCLSLEPAHSLSLTHVPNLGEYCAPRLRAARVSSLSALVGIETRAVASSPLHPGHLGGLRDAYEAWSSQVSPAGAPARMSSVCQA